MVDKRTLKPNKKTTKSKSNTKTQSENNKLESWDDIVKSVLSFINSDKSNEYYVLSNCYEFMLIGKRIKMTELIKNDNNIFQPKETLETKEHYKYFYIFNPNEKAKQSDYYSPIFSPSCSDMALHYMANFR